MRQKKKKSHVNNKNNKKIKMLTVYEIEECCHWEQTLECETLSTKITLYYTEKLKMF